jgi:DNA invertase Pin-like site-specific DNA recombinase
MASQRKKNPELTDEQRLALPIALYCRVSKNTNGTIESVAHQKSAGLKYCAKRWPGRAVVPFEDDGKSAFDPSVKREGYEGMLSAIRRGEIGDVVTKMQSRLTRGNNGTGEEELDLVAFEHFRLVCVRAGLPEFHSRTQGVISLRKGSAGRGRHLAVDDMESSDAASISILEGLEEAAEAGRPPGGKQWGYVRYFDEDLHKAMRPDPSLRDEAQAAAERILAGEPYAVIVDDLNEREVPTAYGNKWTTGGLLRCLTRLTVAGLREHDGEVIEGSWEPLLPRKLWDALVAYRDDPHPVIRSDGRFYTRQPLADRNPSRRYLLTGGFASCGRCGAALIAQQMTKYGRPDKQGNRRVVIVPEYRCVKKRGGCGQLSIMGSPLEDYVVNDPKVGLLAHVDTPKYKRLAAKGDPHAAKRAKLLSEASVVKARRVEAQMLHSEGTYTIEDVREAFKKFDAMSAVVAAKLDALPSVVQPIDAAALAAGWDAMPLKARRQYLSLIGTSCIVHAAQPGKKGFQPSRVTVVHELSTR